MKRMGWVLLLLVVAPTLHALDVAVGSSFKILEIVRSDGKISLPVERDKYYNVRILNKETFDFVQTCTEPCVQNLSDVIPSLQELRPAKTRENMWLATVNFKNAWLVTFLVFKRGDSYSVKPSENFVFLDNVLQTQTRNIILQAVEKMK